MWHDCNHLFCFNSFSFCQILHSFGPLSFVLSSLMQLYVTVHVVLRTCDTINTNYLLYNLQFAYKDLWHDCSEKKNSSASLFVLCIIYVYLWTPEAGCTSWMYPKAACKNMFWPWRRVYTCCTLCIFKFVGLVQIVDREVAKPNIANLLEPSWLSGPQEENHVSENEWRSYKQQTHSACSFTDSFKSLYISYVSYFLYFTVIDV